MEMSIWISSVGDFFISSFQICETNSLFYEDYNPVDVSTFSYCNNFLILVTLAFLSIHRLFSQISPNIDDYPELYIVNLACPLQIGCLIELSSNKIYNCSKYSLIFYYLFYFFLIVILININIHYSIFSPKKKDTAKFVKDKKIYREDSTDSCPICFENYQKLDESYILKCNHHAHADCFNSWWEFYDRTNFICIYRCDKRENYDNEI